MQSIPEDYSGKPERLQAAFKLANHPEILARIEEKRQCKNARARYNLTKRLKRDKCLRLLIRMRSRVRSALKAANAHKTSQTRHLIGCTLDQLKTHLESQFKPGMSWDNYGEWEIDHIRPCCSFDLRKRAQQLICFNFSNMQPLWKSENRSKGGRFARAA